MKNKWHALPLLEYKPCEGRTQLPFLLLANVLYYENQWLGYSSTAGVPGCGGGSDIEVTQTCC